MPVFPPGRRRLLSGAHRSTEDRGGRTRSLSARLSNLRPWTLTRAVVPPLWYVPGSMDVALLALRDRLVDQGTAELSAAPETLQFTGEDTVDALINDIQTYPHAFVLAALVDRQVKAEIAWRLPGRVRDRLGTFEIDDLAKLDRSAWTKVLREPMALHLYPETMAGVLETGSAPDHRPVWRRCLGHLVRDPQQQARGQPIPRVSRCGAQNLDHGREHPSARLSCPDVRLQGHRYFGRRPRPQGDGTTGLRPSRPRASGRWSRPPEP